MPLKNSVSDASKSVSTEAPFLKHNCRHRGRMHKKKNHKDLAGT